MSYRRLPNLLTTHHFLEFGFIFNNIILLIWIKITNLMDAITLKIKFSKI